ncbi:TlpA family protein disulfide reductase [Streptomyces gilvus]|uniref:TlpA family protein disulfide reductase n=1 Tax=Streptomyces gilvus TaxID=2920937 RepID=UPI001F10678B|nr:hypothetical protein [Streptomyces sp. CME 23]MCH5676612.1 hypothetical protein [Streptomyces sp. CME 23]
MRVLLFTLAVCLVTLGLTVGAGAAVLQRATPHAASATASPAAPGLVDVRTGRAFSTAGGSGTLTLVSFLATQPDTAATPSRSQSVVLNSLSTQYGGAGLRVAVVADDPAAVPRPVLLNTSYDWGLRSVVLLDDPGHRAARHFGVASVPTSFLLDGAGTVIAHWDGYLLTAKAAAAIKPHLGSGP